MSDIEDSINIIIEKICSGIIGNFSQLTINCNLLGYDVPKILRRILNWEQGNLSFQLATVLSTCVRIERELECDVILWFFKHDGNFLWNGSGYSRLVSFDFLKTIDKHNPLILIRFFLSFEDNEKKMFEYVKKELFFNTFKMVINRAEKRGAVNPKFSTLKDRLKKVFNCALNYNNFV